MSLRPAIKTVLVARAGDARPRGSLGAPVGVLALVLALSGCGGGTTKPNTAPSPTPSTAAASATTVTVPSQPGALGPERVPIPDGPALGSVKTDNYGQPIDGIQCERSEQVAYHIHAHLTLFVDGQPRQIPLAVGIGPPVQLTTTAIGDFANGGSCFYWLHTHAADGVIHIESPTQQLYTLGQFFDVWGQALGPGQVGPAQGAVTAYVNGQPMTGNPRDIQLQTHGQIQLDVGTVVPPQMIDWSQTGL